MGSRYDYRYMMGTMVCDTPVPYYHMGVSCGLPNEFGNVSPEDIMVPSMLVKGLRTFAIDASGDSMEGVHIYDGDVLLMATTSHYANFDIVLAVVDGEQLLKSYYVDDLGRHWLVPANKNYKAIQLTEEMDVSFQGKMICNLRTPRDTRSNILESISCALKELAPAAPQLRVPTNREVDEALRAVAEQIKVARHWLGACRVLMDRKFIQEGRYDLFCNLVRHAVPEHKHLPQEAELRRMAVACFSKPFDKWTDEKAPVHGTHYLKYYGAGEKMIEKLP